MPALTRETIYKTEYCDIPLASYSLEYHVRLAIFSQIRDFLYRHFFDARNRVLGLEPT